MASKVWKEALFWLHVVAVMMGACCVGMMVNKDFVLAVSDKGIDDYNTKVLFVYATYYGWLVVAFTALISYILGERMQGILIVTVAICSACMYISAGSYNSESYNDSNLRKQLLGAGVIAILCAGVWIAILVLNIIKVGKGEA